MDAKPPSNSPADSKATRQLTPPDADAAEMGLAEIVLVDGSAVRPRRWRPAGQLTRTPAVDGLGFALRAFRPALERRRQP